MLQEYRHATAQLHTERLRGVTTLTAKELLEVVFRDGERPQHIEVDGTTNNYLGISSVMIDYQERRDNAARQRAFEYDPPIKQLHAKIGDDVTVKFTRDR
ncbi:hypothetical protein MTX80_03420 [Gordonia amicalis]|nr:hypothetical protein [Gordonia amicalis]UOG22148.1 hypothetical protein MTX80_03420 [Gordonia amicalis]